MKKQIGAGFSQHVVMGVLSAYGRLGGDRWRDAATNWDVVNCGPTRGSNRVFAVMAILGGGLLLAFSEDHHQRKMGGLIFGVGIVCAVAEVVTWAVSQRILFRELQY